MPDGSLNLGNFTREARKSLSNKVCRAAQEDVRRVAHTYIIHLYPCAVRRHNCEDTVTYVFLPLTRTVIYGRPTCKQCCGVEPAIAIKAAILEDIVS